MLKLTRRSQYPHKMDLYVHTRPSHAQALQIWSADDDAATIGSKVTYEPNLL